MSPILTIKAYNTGIICIKVNLEVRSLIELNKKQVKEIRKLLKNGIEVPDVCTQYNIPPETWRDVSMKYEFYK